MNTKDVDRLINESSLGNQFKSGWYGFKVSCDLHDSGHSNMSPSSSQEYCNRIPKKKIFVKGFLKTLCYDKGKPRPNYDPLHCNWRVCPKLKEILK